MEQEDRERLVRLEEKVDLILPVLPLVRDHEVAIGILRRVLGFLGSAVIALVGAAGVSFFKKQ